MKKSQGSLFCLGLVYFSLGILTSQEKITFISIFNSLIQSRIPLKIFHFSYCGTPEEEKRKEKKKRENKPYYFLSKIVTHVIPKTSLMIYFIL